MAKRLAHRWDQTRTTTIENFVAVAEQISHAMCYGAEALDIHYQNNCARVYFTAPSVTIAKEFVSACKEYIPYPDLAHDPIITRTHQRVTVEFTLLVNELTRSHKLHRLWAVKNIVKTKPRDNLLQTIAAGEVSLPSSLTPEWSTANGLFEHEMQQVDQVNAALIVLGKTLQSHSTTATIQFTDERLDKNIAAFNFVLDKPATPEMITHLKSYYTTVACYEAATVELWEHPDLCGHFTELKDRWYQLRVGFNRAVNWNPRTAKQQQYA